MHKPGGYRKSGIARRLFAALLAAGLVIVAPVAALAAETSPGKKIDPVLLQASAREQVTFWVTFRAAPDLGRESTDRNWRRRGARVVDKLKDNAAASQAKVEKLLAQRGVARRSFWISNTVQVTGDRKLMHELAARSEVERIVPDGALEVPPLIPAEPVETQALEWGIQEINADDAWGEFSARGDGIVIANIDTGVQFDHPALAGRYRGNLGGSFDHNYNWFDPAKTCGDPSVTPCDSGGHGTHTMGTMVGDDGNGNQIGVAPDATWIAAKGCESSSCSFASLLASGEWILAPTDLTGANPRPDLRPNIVNNSWGGAGGSPFYADIVDAWVAAGIFPTFSNGNSGPTCGSAGSPGDYAASYGVGAYASGGTIASFSSRGSGAAAEMKPNLAAPGVAVRSSIPGDSYSAKSGTSMAAPHVAGAVALMWSAAPALIGDVEATRTLLDETAVDVADLSCGGTEADNAVWGEGKLDARAAVEASPRGPTGTLEGTVTAGGPGATGARVQAVGPTTRTTTVKGDGSYRLTLPAGPYLVTVDGFGLLPRSLEAVTVQDQTTVLDFSLTAVPGHQVSGTVADGDGRALAGVRVTISGTPLPAQITGEGGEFTFASVPEGSYQLALDPRGCLSPGRPALVVDGPESLELALDRRTDAFGYTCSEAAPAYVEAGTVTSLTGLDRYLAVPLPFPFSFYGTSYGTANVATHGFLTFGNPSTRYYNGPLPETSAPNAAVYPYWDDFYPDASSSIRTQELGAEPDRRFVVEWRNMRYFGDSTRRVDFEAVLHQSGVIEFQFRNIDDDAKERGNSATIGIENAAGTLGLQYSLNAALLPAGDHGIRLATAVSLANTAPDAVSDSATAGAGLAATIDVLANDSDPEGDELQVTAVSKPAQGTAAINPSGTVTYTSTSTEGGFDHFTYDIADGKGGTDRAEVFVGVAGNHPPITNPDAATTPAGRPVDIDVLANDSDPEGHPLTLGAVSEPSHGTAAALTGGVVRYTPDPGFTGTDQFTYQAADAGGAASPATVTVTVTPNGPPVAVADSAEVGAGGTVDIDVLANDSDPEGDALTLGSVVSGAHGTAVSRPGNLVNFTPAAGFTGTARFSYTVTDGHGGSATGEVTVAVSGPQTQQMPLSVWHRPFTPALDTIGSFIVPLNDPAAGAGQAAPHYRYAQTVWFSDLTAHATFMLAAEGSHKYAFFTVTDSTGRTTGVRHDLDWQAGQVYYLYLQHVGTGRWAARIVNGGTGADTALGWFQMRPDQQTIHPVYLTYLQWTGATPTSCAAYPAAKAIMIPFGYRGGTPYYQDASNSVGEGDCASVNLSVQALPYTFGYQESGG